MKTFVQQPCPIEQYGLKSKTVRYVPIKDSNGIPTGKLLKVTEGSKLHKQIFG